LTGFLLSVVSPPIVSKWYIAIINFRTFSVPQIVIAQYYEFFKHNPLTYMSHVNGLNWFLAYPYDGPYPVLIGEYFYGSSMNANAGLWAGDGLAGFGLPGIIIMSSVCAFVFWILDSVSRRNDPAFIAGAMTLIVVSFTNTPLSTTFLSGGLGLLFLAVLTMPRGGLLTNTFREKIPTGRRGGRDRRR
jgi:hypothetical protein